MIPNISDPRSAFFSLPSCYARHFRSLAAAAVAGIALIAGCATASAQTFYTVTDLGFEVRDINDSGVVVGVGGGHAVRWTSTGGIEDLGTLGGVGSYAVSVSNAGEIVGLSQIASGEYRAFSWTEQDGMQEVGLAANYFPDVVNDAGQILGEFPGGAFLWSPSTGVTDLGTLGGPGSEPPLPFALNNSGQAVGSVFVCDNYNAQTQTCLHGMFRGFLWTAQGGMQDIGPAGSRAEARAVNDAGTILGQYFVPDDPQNPAGPGNFHGFLRTSGGTIQDLGFWSGQNAHPWDINNAGQIVGKGFNQADALTPRAVIWTATGFVYLNDRLTGSFLPNLDVATRVNSQGQILAGENTNIYLLNPVLDTDNDGVPDSSDNCVLVSNADQRDTNGDGFGNICDADLNNDSFVGFPDLSLFRAAFGTANANADFDGIGPVVNFSDLARFRGLFGRAPGPSGLHP